MYNVKKSNAMILLDFTSVVCDFPPAKYMPKGVSTHFLGPPQEDMPNWHLETRFRNPLWHPKFLPTSGPFKPIRLLAFENEKKNRNKIFTIAAPKSKKLPLGA